MNDLAPPPLPKKSSAGKWIFGCGIGCLAVVIILIVVSIFGTKYAMKKVGEVDAKYNALGYEKVESQLIEVNEVVDIPMYYKGQIVKIMADHNADLAILAQMAEIHGRVKGNVYFTGQALIVQPDAIVEGDMEVMAQFIQVLGEVQGEVTGKYQQLEE